MAYTILDVTKEKMDKVTAHFSESLATVRTGRANTTMLDHVEVDYYGSPTPVNQIASISVVEGRTLVIKPYDSSSLKNIEKACNEADLGIAPQNDGTVIRLTVPALTEETRKEMCKKVSKYAEEAKVQIRNLRRDGNDAAKKDDTLTEDMEKDCLDKIQKLTDEFIKKIDDIAANKEKEVMTI
ncbi:ribosome recycling factor [Anaerorhabdus sp.]|uniref:ribosome recycling factor n=1 Tax=Anaerorhabdus sp. TaxID=1872524 RepID=UPI002B204D06|nr:ribosome recycling factor [Anaerorhabdus sp.]MEA4875106.1 ribosome recycling factor [Anaerorhabdus sp.]